MGDGGVDPPRQQVDVACALEGPCTAWIEFEGSAEIREGFRPVAESHMGFAPAEVGGHGIGLQADGLVQRSQGLLEVQAALERAAQTLLGRSVAGLEIDGGFEVYNVPLPAVLGVKEGINLPRYPTMKGRLASKKAEVVVDERSAGAGGQERVRLHRPVETVSETVILGTGPEAASAIVDLLEELGVLS